MTESDTDAVSLHALTSDQFQAEDLPPQRFRSGRTVGRMRGNRGRLGAAAAATVRRGG